MASLQRTPRSLPPARPEVLLLPSGLTEQLANHLGSRLHQTILVTALLTGVALLGSRLFSWDRWLLGLIIGLLYSNGFEYVYHRFLLHSETGQLSEDHRLHHETFGQFDEALHVSFGGSPGGVVLLITANSLPFVLLDYLGAGIGAGVLTGFVLYMVLFEEMHWRIHMSRLPRRLEWVRRHHFAHHKGEPGKFNVFLPLCDLLFSGKPEVAAACRRPARGPAPTG